MSEGTLQIIWIVGLVIVALLQLLAANQQVKWRLYSPARQAFRGIWAIGGFAVILLFGGVPVNIVFAVAFAVVGVALGYVAGRMSQFKYAGSKVALKRSPFAPWVLAITYIVAFAFLLFGTADLYSVGLLLVLFAVAMDDGALVAEIMKGSAASKGSAAVPQT